MKLMTPTQTRQTLKTIMDWMKKTGQKYIDDEFISFGIWPDPKKPDSSVRLTFPMPLNTYRTFHESLGQEFTEDPYFAYQDRGFGEEYVNEEDGEKWRFPENRLYFVFEGQKFIWRWMTGQGDAAQIIFAGEFERAPFEDDKMIEIK